MDKVSFERPFVAKGLQFTKERKIKNQHPASNFLKQSTQFLEQYYIKLIFQTRSLLDTTVHVVGDNTYSTQSYHIL